MFGDRGRMEMRERIDLTGTRNATASANSLQMHTMTDSDGVKTPVNTAGAWAGFREATDVSADMLTASPLMEWTSSECG